MFKNLSMKTMSLMAVVVLSLSLLITGVTIQIVRAQASVGFQGVYHSHELHQEALFTQSGINPNVVTALSNLLNSEQIGGPNQTRRADAFSNYAQSHHATRTHGAVYVRLFDHNINPAGQVSGTETTNVNLFTRSGSTTHGPIDQGRWWRVVNLENGVLTLWMADPYRNSAFHASSNVYSTSIVVSNLRNDFNAVLGAVTDSTARAQITDAIIPAGDPRLAGTVTNAGRSNTHPRAGDGTHTFSNPAVPTDDLVWLPSWYEILNTSTTTQFPTDTWIGAVNAANRLGRWRVSAYDRGHAAGGFSTDAWLRSGHSTGATFAGLVHTNGNRSWNTVSYAHAVRPALHISVANLAQAKINAGMETGANAASTVRSPAVGGGTASTTPITMSGRTATMTFDAGVGHTISGVTIPGRNPGALRTATAIMSGWQNLPGGGGGQYRLQSLNNGREWQVELQELNHQTFTTTAPLTLRASTAINTYTVALPTVTTIDGIQSVSNLQTSPVNHGGQFTFTMTLNASHSNRGNDQITISHANAGTITVSGSGTNRTVTVTNVTGIIGATGWTIGGLGDVDANTYTVAIPASGPGWTTSNLTPSNGQVAHNGQFTFTLTVLPSHTDNSNPVVSWTGASLGQIAQGTGNPRTVTISQVTGNISATDLTVSGIQANRYAVVIPAGSVSDGWITGTSLSNPLVDHGDSFTFTVTIEQSHSVSTAASVAWASGATGLGTLTQVRNGNQINVTVTNLQGAVTASDINVTGITRNRYNVVQPTAPGGAQFSFGAPSQLQVYHGLTTPEGTFTFTLTRNSTGVTFPTVTLTPGLGAMTFAETSETVRTFTVNNVLGNITAGNFTVGETTVVSHNVAAPNPQAGVLVSAPTPSVVQQGVGTFTFTLTLADSHSNSTPSVVLARNGTIQSQVFDQGVLTVVVGNVMGIIEAADWTINGVAINTFTITFDSRGGSAVTNITGIKYGTTATRPTDPTLAGQSFVNWFTDEERTIPFVWTTAITQNITLFADWTTQQITINFVTVHPSTVDDMPASMSGPSGSSITQPTPNPTRPGWVFAGWFIGSPEGTAMSWSTMPSSNVTLHARWTLYLGDLNDAIAQAEAALADRAYFTPGSITNLEQAIANARNTRDTATTTGQVQGAIDFLNATREALIVDIRILTDLMQIEFPSALFTVSSFNNYVTAFNAAADWVNAGDFSLQGLKDRVEALEIAIDGLVPRFTFANQEEEDAFWDLLDQIRDQLAGGSGNQNGGTGTGSHPGNYTPDSWENYQDALDRLLELLNDANSTIEQLRDALAAVEAARDALVGRVPAAGEPTWADDNLWWLLIIVGGVAGLLASLLFVLVERNRRRG